MVGPSKYEAEQETKQQAHSNAVRELSKSRNRLKDALSGAEGHAVPPFRSLINREPPTPDSKTGEYPSPQWGKKLRLCHAAALELGREVAPYRDRVPEMWRKELVSVQFPEVGDMRRVRRRFQNDDIYQSKLSFQTTPVALKNLDAWAFNEVWLKCRYNEKFYGERTTSRREKVHLPVAACGAIYEQINKILEEISMLAEIREVSASDNDPGKPDDLDAWEDYKQ